MKLTCKIKVDIAVEFLANIAQCKAVFPCAGSVRLKFAPNVNKSLVGSKLKTFQHDHINGVIPPLSTKSGLIPLAIK